VCLIDDFEKEAETWELKFPRKYRAEKIRGLPSMRGLFDDLFKKHQKPPNPTLFAEKVWEHSTGIKPELKEDVMARARRAHPSFVREAHFQLVLKDRLHGVAKVLSNVELDMKNKTDFLVCSITSPVQLRIHTYTDTARANHYAEMKKKEPLTYTKYHPKDNESLEDSIIIDLRLPIIKGSGKELVNGLWLYDSGHADEVYDTLHEIHADEGYTF
jgi:hypothetical protein